MGNHRPSATLFSQSPLGRVFSFSDRRILRSILSLNSLTEQTNQCILVTDFETPSHDQESTTYIFLVHSSRTSVQHLANHHWHQLTLYFLRYPSPRC